MCSLKYMYNVQVMFVMLGAGARSRPPTPGVAAQVLEQRTAPPPSSTPLRRLPGLGTPPFGGRQLSMFVGSSASSLAFWAASRA